MKRLFLCLLLVGGSGRAWAGPGNSLPPTDTARLRQHLQFLTTTPQPRNYQHPVVLDSVARYIQRSLRAAGAQEIGEQP